MTERLSPALLPKLGAAVERPRYDRATLAEGVVHLGLGAFHRAHQAAYLDEIAARGDLRWGVVGVSLRSPAVRDTLAPQDGLYTLVERDAAGERARIMAPLKRVLVAPEAPAAVVAAMAQPSVRIVTLTVTEKGYGLARDRGELDAADPGVAADMASLGRPRTAVGFIVAALNARRDAGLPPFTAISCDNLPDNGALLRDAVLALAGTHDPGLAEWIATLRRVSRARWSTASSRRRRPRRSRPMPRRTATATRRSSRPSGSASGCCRTRSPASGPISRAAGVTLDRGRRAVGRSQAAAAQRRALDDRLPRRPRRDRARPRVRRQRRPPRADRPPVGRERRDAGPPPPGSTSPATARR